MCWLLDKVKEHTIYDSLAPSRPPSVLRSTFLSDLTSSQGGHRLFWFKSFRQNVFAFYMNKVQLSLSFNSIFICLSSFLKFQDKHKVNLLLPSLEQIPEYSHLHTIELDAFDHLECTSFEELLQCWVCLAYNSVGPLDDTARSFCNCD